MKKKHLSAIRLPVILILTIWISNAFHNDNNNPKEQPNILVLMTDNHSWNHLGCYGDAVVKTPTIDKISKEGIRFSNAFCSAPSCTPARASMLTGQDIWRLEEGANLHGFLPAKFEVFPDLLEEAGYLVGHQGKGWGPGNYKAGGRERNPAGNKYRSFVEFLSERKDEQPFLYWFSSRDPHRPYSINGVEEAGIDTSKIIVPPYLPDCADTRKDMADYYAEIQHFDTQVADFLHHMDSLGVVENTMVIVVSDNGWQMPRGLANLYEMGTKIPMIISMPERFMEGRVVDDFVTLNDLAPTFLELAGLPIPESMTAKSLVNILESKRSGIIESERDFVVTARERHAYVRKNGAGYGGRAIQTNDYLYIRNYDPERWPAGDPPLYGDVDAHMLEFSCPTKMFLLINKEDEAVKPLFDLAFGKRPAEEFYDLTIDPYQLNNVAYDPDYAEVKAKTEKKLLTYLIETGDPRVTKEEMKWIDAEYFAIRDFKPRPYQEAIELLGLKEEYSFNE